MAIEMKAFGVTVFLCCTRSLYLPFEANTSRGGHASSIYDKDLLMSVAVNFSDNKTFSKRKT